MVGGLRCAIICTECNPNRSRGYGAVGVEYSPSALLWPVAYTTACNTAQAVILCVYVNRAIKASKQSIMTFLIGEGCPSDFTLLESVNGCYKLGVVLSSWSDAATQCHSVHPDAHLAVINNDAESNAVGNWLTAYPECNYSLLMLTYRR